MSSIVGIIEQSMMHDLNKVNVSSQNMSNVTTNGYKRDVVGKNTFDVHMVEDNYYDVPKIVINERDNIDKFTDFSSSSVKTTNNPLNVSLRGSGFFVVNTSHGEAYTRNGDFKLDTKGRLVTQAGFVVSGLQGEIRLTNTTPRIAPDGVIWDGKNKIGQLAVVEFDSSAINHLTRETSGLYTSKNSRPVINESPSVIQGYLEASNVDSAFEMINTVETLRHFELNQKLLHMQQESYKSMLDSLGEF